MRKYDAIDILKLRASGSTNGWNEVLSRCLENLDINSLCKLKYGLQAGMDDVAKNKLNTPEISVWFLRLVRSIDITAKKIIRIKHPLPQDNPLLANKKEYASFKEAKKRRDFELAEFMRLSSY